ncbi:MAG: hypothetical protein M3Y08_21000, partial [Fibrobacterota bacterium]|nr:hypothetical protein [Fibrobacterota bacterium]
MDPDLDGTNGTFSSFGDIVEYTWTSFNTGILHWTASPTETQRDYVPMVCCEATQMEKNAYLRVVDVTNANPGDQFFLIYWPWFGGPSSNNSAVSFILKAWSSDTDDHAALPR